MKKHFNEKNYAINWIRGAIISYLAEKKPGNTLEKTIGVIRRGYNYGSFSISKQVLQEILNEKEFDNYKSSPRYKDLIERCKEETFI